MSQQLSRAVIAQQLEQRYAYGPQEAHAIATGLVQDQAIQAAASALLQQPATLPALSIGDHTLAGLVQQHSLVPLQALQLLARELQEPGTITLLLEEGAERAVPFIASRVVRIYQDGEHYTVVSTQQRGGPLWSPAFVSDTLVAQLWQPHSTLLAQAIQSASSQNQTPSSGPRTDSGSLLSINTPLCWQIHWNTRQPHSAEVIIELEENIRYCAQQRVRAPIWRLVDPAYRYLYASAPVGVIAEWVLCWEALVGKLACSR